MKIENVAYHRNGVSGNGFHVVRFHDGRGLKAKSMIAVVFGDRHNIAVLQESSDDRFDGPYFEDAVRLAILAFEEKRAAGPLLPEEIRDLTFGRHKEVPGDDHACVICKGAHTATVVEK